MFQFGVVANFVWYLIWDRLLIDQHIFYFYPNFNHPFWYLHILQFVKMPIVLKNAPRAIEIRQDIPKSALRFFLFQDKWEVFIYFSEMFRRNLYWRSPHAIISWWFFWKPCTRNGRHRCLIKWVERIFDKIMSISESKRTFQLSLWNATLHEGT